ncbi:MAG TPA: serine/threonine-protein kinase [Polyangia bacterium]|nr:serine/threonine-protein kinase [Polyangia bacterium]
MKACPNCHSKYPDDANFCPQETCATPQGPRRLEPVPAEPAPRFQLTSKLGGGRSGEVWVARDAQTGDDVAYKLVTPEVLPTPAASERALRELKQLQRAQNPHLVRIVDFGRSGDGRLFVATELANGQPLDRLVQGAGALPVDRAKKIVAQIGEALLEGQKVGVVHHDLSAKNVLVGSEDAVKVINFVTPWPITDTIFGVPEYLSPEQAEGKLVDQRSNTYSLGAILQLMLTGQPPVAGGDVQTVLAQVIQGTVTPPSQLRQGLTPEIDRVVLKAMEKNSSRRPLTMRQFLAEVAGVVGLPAGPAAAPTAGAKGAAFAKTMMFAGGAPEVQNLVNQAQAARDAANGAAAASAAASLPKAPTPAPVADPATLAAARRTHGAAVAATMMALPSAASGPLPGALPPAEPRPAPTPAPAVQAAAPSGGGGGGGAGGGGGGAAGGGGGSGGGGAGFRETLWFKKGDVEQMVAEAKAKAAAAAAKGKPAPVVEEAPVEDVKPLEDRYKDDGSVTVEDRKKFSLRSGGTAAGLPVVAGVVPGERMSDNEMINEIGGGKKIAIIGVAVAVVAIIVAVIVMSMHKKHDGAAAEAPAAKPAEMAAATPPPPAAPAAPAPAAPAAAPAPIAAAPAEAPAAAETPPKAQAGPAHKHVAKAATKATKKKAGKKHH